ncbi:threo-3-hydroxy-L-aspartate ammonia-lyase [Verminephrobacter aporrectodeae subsp. tuberculatae]|uniref:threo-3-hydroxy-L-aspartate ammonia-lyase n=1 Tax=Verminephrobacter aporrectodeae TaxID=1110389 RepID=UPI002242CBF7|nr:threo-3-hydroxy-L-aspartate ammonia-lyase [Verminephrobacter aporrectodeae]MCW8163783.1 threo-3-hydroxy-L-aspartate ammonia-lyase [Verminephrobacter aporrectodeae subsp. tuberculatae]MCW8168018.1 threo-3-hydroxy-L-aspartate ammonia-lyase [Verminephrobacter aporrectodeae subsp. tuberculatae]
MTTLPAPTYDDVVAAAGRIAGHAHRTPVLTSRSIDTELGARLFFKCENLQRMGAFKFRGAFNALARFDAAQRRAGVIAFSSGNHAQSIALAARELGIPATVVMPQDAPASKIAATQGYGASVVFYDRYAQDREQITRALAERDGLTLIPPYDHADVLAGQGTAAKELFEEVGPLDAFFVCLGGGGLLSGCALATRALAPGCTLYGVEPAAGNDGQRSFRSGSIVHIDTPKTIADGAQTQHLGQLTFPIIRRDVDDILTVTDAQLIDGMRSFAERMKLIVEPTGCLGFAAARAMRQELQGQRVGVLISGGNVDLARFCALLAA